MISIYFFILITFNCLYCSQSLQTGYTCETSIALTCSQLKKLVILEVIYSSECPSPSNDLNGTSIYAPSRCIAYHRERITSQCNGKKICTIDNSVEKRPSFFTGKQANCVFRGQSINIEYLCIPDFESSQLSRIDICSSSSMNGVNEGFIHTPNYPYNYPNNMNCVKTIPAPDAGHRLKIYAVDFDVESSNTNRLANVARSNDWLEINNNEEKLYGSKTPFTLIFDDVIEASLMFKSDSVNSKRSYNGFLLYFIVMPVRRSRPPVTTKLTTTPIPTEIAFDDVTTSTSTDIPFDEVTSSMQQEIARLTLTKRREKNIGLILLVVLLSCILVILICSMLLYKRRNDRRIRYFMDTFNSFGGKKSESVTMDPFEESDETKLDLKHELSSITIENDKSNSKYLNELSHYSDHIYSEDPVEEKLFLKTNDSNSSDYEYIDYAEIKKQTNDQKIFI